MKDERITEEREISKAVIKRLPRYYRYLGELDVYKRQDQSGTTPEGIGYGTVYTQEELNRALENAEPFSIVPSRDDSGHGTKLAAIAAGSENLETGWIGAAPPVSYTHLDVYKRQETVRAGHSRKKPSEDAGT